MLVPGLYIDFIAKLYVECKKFILLMRRSFQRLFFFLFLFDIIQELVSEARFWGAFGLYSILTMVRDLFSTS